MPIKPINDWKSSLKDLPKVADTTWALNFANWYANNITSISPDPTMYTDPGFTFTFQSSIFQAQLLTLMPTLNALQGITGFANAWEAAILASIALSAPGAILMPASPATTFSTVITTLIDPASIVLGKAKILELASASPVENANDSQFPVKFREATLQLTFTVVGLNSVPPPAGPQPLTAANIKLV